MNIQSGFYYHIKDVFFDEVQDDALMANKEDGNYRPHFLAIQDFHNSGIYWMIPVSSKFEKYKKIYNHQIVKYKKCTKIVLGKCNGQDAAFLIQNAFPTTADYFDHIHTSKGKPLSLHGTTAKLSQAFRPSPFSSLYTAIFKNNIYIVFFNFFFHQIIDVVNVCIEKRNATFMKSKTSQC